MTVMTGEMTLAEIYRDPLILSVMTADGVALAEFKQIMVAAAASLKTRIGTPQSVKIRTTVPVASTSSQIAAMQPLFAGSFQPCCANL